MTKQAAVWMSLAPGNRRKPPCRQLVALLLWDWRDPALGLLLLRVALLWGWCSQLRAWRALASRMTLPSCALSPAAPRGGWFASVLDCGVGTRRVQGG